MAGRLGLRTVATSKAEGRSRPPLRVLGATAHSCRRSVQRGQSSALTAGRTVPCSRPRRSDILGSVETILSVVQVAVSVILIFLVLMHSGKDSGLSGAFGVGSGTGPLGGGSLVERNLNRWTIFFAVVFFLNALVLLKAPWA
jgi:preprotein translocase subunit SecG